MVPAKKKKQKNKNIFNKAKINKKELDNIILEIKAQEKKTKIIAVTKTLSIDAVNSAIENNIYTIGENRVDEVEKKYKGYVNRKKIELHLIGHLQSNKTKKAVNLFDVIQTADSEKIIKKIDACAANKNKKQKIFIQINIGKDKNKFGFSEDFYEKVLKKTQHLKNIEITGVMTILPQNLNQKERKALYSKIKKIQQKIQKKYYPSCLLTSMGMSSDYEDAVSEGSSYIRIGTKLYGKRN
jgi:pyridoxal phosphate enzyme (YggS family)